MKKYKILHIITRWTSGGGAEKNTYFTIKGLNKDRYEVDLIIGGDSKSMPDNLKGVKVIKINSLRRNIHPIDEFRAFFQLYSLIKKNKYDLVHTHLAKAGMLGRLAAKIAGIPIIVHSLHGSLFHNALNPVVKFIYRKLEQFSALYTTWFISVGEDLKFRYLKSRIVGMVASLEPRKGHKYAIEVAQEIIKKHPKVTFLFVGEGYLNFKLEKIVQEKNLQRCIIFTGLRKDIERVMAVFDILILTSLWEGLPQVLVQGAIMGKPMVSFNVEGSNELIQEGKNGFIVPLKDVPKMIEKLDYLISNLKMAKMMGENGKEIVNQEWEIDNMVEKTNKLYSYLLNGKEQR